MTESFRIDTGGMVDRGTPLRFTFNGRRFSGLAGDTLASALLANGVRLTGRSFKYHRPRGIQGAGFEEPATLVQLAGGEQATNLPVTRVQLRNGLVARSVNCWPSVHFDIGAIAGLFARLLPAGFYYKTFMWPNWHLFEPFIRRAAGLGHAPSRDPRQLRYETRYDHCDVLVVGAGPAGLAAAQSAAASGARVLLVDDDQHPGGRLLADGGEIDGQPATDWIEATTAELDQHEHVTRLTDASAWAYHEHNYLLVTERSPDKAHLFQRTRRVRARRVVLASGAIERPLAFAGNDLPGVMLASAVRSYLRRYAVRPGAVAVVFTNNDSAWQTALDLHGAGVTVAAVIDSREHPGESLVSPVREAGIPVLTGYVVARAQGGRLLRSVTVTSRAGGQQQRIGCDLLCVSGGWNPAVHLFSQSRGSLRYDDTLASFLPDVAVQQCVSAGASNGTYDLQGCLAEGARAGREAALACGFTANESTMPAATGNDSHAVEALWQVRVPSSVGGKRFVDVQNDVTSDDLELATREGYRAVEHVKRYTTAGMGVDQGKTGNVNVIGSLADQAGVAPGDIGTTTFRPPFVPIEFGALVGYRPGDQVLPYRHTPMTAWHKQRGAVMYEAGARWRRPGYYPLPGESMQQAINRECTAVREGVGMYDGAPLGKFEVKGPDVVALLELIYTCNMGSLEIGAGRYGLMLSDDGLILDDGVCFRLGEHNYLISTSTGHADSVHRHLEYVLQVERPDWQVALTPVTAHWVNATVCGPEAREVVRRAGTDIDLDNAAFPFMSLRNGQVAGLDARVFRVSFTGELSYEINVPARDGLALWQALMEAGAALGITPVGSEASHVLRVEKGFLSLAHEVDATADAFDLGMGWIMSKTKRDYFGKRAVEIRRAPGTPRRELVGLLMEDPERFVIEGSPITPGGRRVASEGFVSACVWSVVNRRTVALGMLEDGRARHGEWIHVRMKEQVVRAQVTAPVFHDPAGRRLKD